MRLMHAAAAVAIAACAPVHTEWPTVAPDTDFDIAVGATVGIDGSALAIRFDTVSEDSRCPTDAQCVWEGNATLRLTVDSAGTARRVELRTAGNPPPVAAFGHQVGYRALRPAPTTAGPIAPRSYIATLRVTR